MSQMFNLMARTPFLMGKCCIKCLVHPRISTFNCLYEMLRGLRWNLTSMLSTFSFGSLALLLTRPYISCSEAPTGLRSVLCLPDGLCLCSEVSWVTPGSDGDDTEGDEVRQGLTAPVRLSPGTQGSGLDSDPASLNLRSLRPTPASCIISPDQGNSETSASWGGH